ncbi:uncharacterized protein EHS24_000457 [Apiotrichum porosum]|uniref:Cyclin N-terminal domain-containing protein n=1 Tax=Apiotrichum porosum TaxID=105984 RepID=A0A427YA90_9TREE|nr:uncharacterized protein EHS24_000457 [Apiotrichum porosum]RSH87935.1 hypothetical protein EHS24_000457 [Apiotrichum porosum]
MFSQAEINLMEKQLLFLLDYNLSITEEEVVAYAQPFLEQYSFDTPPLSPAAASPASSTQTLPVTPRLPSGAVVLPSCAGSSKAGHVSITPALDRSVSTSSLGSEGPLTPRSSSSSPSHDMDDDDEEILVPEHALAHAHDAVFAGTRREHMVDNTLSPPESAMPAKDRPADARESLVRRLFGRRRDDFLHM